MFKLLLNKIQMVLSKAIIKAVTDDAGIQLVKVTGLAGEVLDKVEHLQPYGLSAHPPEGSEAFLGFIGGNRDHPVAIVVDSAENRIKGLKTGESVLYSKYGNRIKLDENGRIIFNGGSDFMVRFTELETAFNALRDDFNTHKHPVEGVTPGSASVTAGVTTGLSTADISGSKAEDLRI